MRYWVYIKDKVVGPYTEDQLAALEEFTPETLVCAEEVQADGSQDWVKASSLFDFNAPAPADTQAAAPASDANAATAGLGASAAQILIDKIDKLTQEIEGMKTKLDESIAASTAAQQAAQQAAAVAPATVTAAPTTNVPTENPVVEDAVITNTQSLISHAEEVVAQAGTEDTQEKPLDFLNEIHIGDNSADDVAATPGEEVVLRSALDSLYNAKVQTEEEKEITFQDLLSPFKAAAAGAAVGAAGAAIAAGASSQEAKENEEGKVSEPAADITDEKREEIINDITAPAPQEDAVLQAIGEAQDQAPVSDMDTLNETPSEKQPLDLADQPQLNIAQEGQPLSEAPQETKLPSTAEPAFEMPAPAEHAELTPMDPAAALQAENGSKNTLETAQELVPGKELKDENSDGILSQTDLDEAFSEKMPTEDEFPVTQIEKPLPQAGEFYNPKDMTEVQLKEGSTYLISDFIPPTTASKPAPLHPKPAEDFIAPKDKDAVEEMVPAAAAAAAAAIAAETEVPDQPSDVAPIENVPEQTQEQAPESSEEKEGKEEKPEDLLLSKIVLENTIKTKRGASMDIKTAPMMQEPADSDRLDLSDSDLDINAQHDLKTADFKQSGSGLTKIILGALVTLVLLVAIYIMLGYLEVIPAKFNLLSKKPAATQSAQKEVVNEMLGKEDPVAPTTELVASQDESMEMVLDEVKNLPMANGQTLQQLIESRHPAATDMIDWSITTAVEPDNYSVLVKVPPENPQSFKISYRFNYNALTQELEPTISDSKNLLDSIAAQ